MTIADAAFVRRLAGRLDLPFETARRDVAALAAERDLSPELAGREARHAFFAAAARRHRCRRVVLGHHADDQVETVLMNLFRGAGLKGVAGMRERGTLTADGIELELHRPLLGLRREELRDFLAKDRLHFREDASNDDPAHLRNRVRHRLLPLLGEVFARDVRGAVLRLAALAAEDEDLLDQLAGEAAAAAAAGEDLFVRPLRELAPALRGRLLGRWLRAAGVPDVGKGAVDRAAALLPPGAPAASVNLPGRWRLRRRAGRLFLEPPG